MQSTALQDINGFTGGIVFDEPSSLTGAAPNSKPASVAYTIRLNSETLSGVGNSNLTSTTQYGPDGTSAEYLSLFLPLQLAVEETIAVVTTNSNTTMEFLTREFPFPAYTVDIGTEVLANLIPIYFVLIFSLQVRPSLFVCPARRLCLTSSVLSVLFCSGSCPGATHFGGEAKANQGRHEDDGFE